MAKDKIRARKKLFIDPQVQGALLRKLAQHWLYGMLVAFTCLLVMEIFSQGVDKTFSAHLAAIWRRYGMLFVVIMCTFPAFAYDSIKLSHRFAGPIYAMRVALRKMANGEPVSEIKFRKDDYWLDIAGDLNKIAARLDATSRDGQSDATGSETLREALDETLTDAPKSPSRVVGES